MGNFLRRPDRLAGQQDGRGSRLTITAGYVWFARSTSEPVHCGYRIVSEDARIFTSAYGGGEKSVVVCAVPALVERTLPAIHDPVLADLLLVIVAHEMTHMRQARRWTRG